MIIHFFSYLAGQDKLNLEYFNLFFKSAQINNIPLTVLREKEFTSYRRKLVLLHDRILKLGDNEIVLMTDGFDVLYLNNEKEILERFLSMNCNILYNSEKNFMHQNKKYQPTFEEHDDKFGYKFLNSGAFIGYVSHMKKMLEFYFDPHNVEESVKYIISQYGRRYMKRGESEQYLIGEYFALNPGKITLDRECSIFYNMAFDGDNPDEFICIRDGRLFNKTTGTYPCILHIPNFKRRGLVKKLFIDLYGDPAQQHAPVAQPG